MQFPFARQIHSPYRAPQIALEGLDGAGKTTIGHELSKELGLAFIEFPTDRVSRDDDPVEFNINCHLDRLYFDSPIDYIAGRWSASGIAYAGSRAGTPEEEAKEYRKALRREENIPEALLTVFVGTSAQIRMSRLNSREAIGSLEETFELPEIQCRAGSAYARLFSGAQESRHGKNILIVSGEDLRADVDAIVAEYIRRKLRGIPEM